MSAEPMTNQLRVGVHATGYHQFMLMLKWCGIALGAAVTFLTMWFCSSAGFGWGLITGILVFIAGAYAMSHGLSASSDRETMRRL